MKQEFFYPSKDGLTQIHTIEWIPEGDVRGILQIAHGMVEFIDRYDRFASFMASQGFYVVGNDHLGHGQSVTDQSQLGYFAKHDGNFCVLGDMREMGSNSRELHRQIGRYALEHGVELLLTQGDEAAFFAEGAGAIATHFPDRTSLLAALPERICPGDVVLVKASHGPRFEDVAETIENLR